MKTNLKLVAQEYKKMDELKPVWKKELDKINSDLLELDDKMAIAIDHLSNLSVNRERLLNARKTVLEKATSPSLF